MHLKKIHTVIAIFSLAVLSACQDKEQAPSAAPAPVIEKEQVSFSQNHPQLKLLTVAQAESASNIPVELPAKLVWNEDKTQRIYPAFAGKVLSINADVGQAVQPGTPLAFLASPDFGQAQSDTAKAMSDMNLASKAFERQKELFQAGVAARKDLEQAEAEAQRANAEYARSQAKTKLYGSVSGINQQLSLSSTVKGIVVERNINPGQELRPDLTGPGVPALFVVSDPSSLWIQVDARESEVSIAQVGTSFELTAPGLRGQKFSGQVTAVSDFIDPFTRTFKIRGVVSNKSRVLKAEMLATAVFQRAFAKGIVIPSSALLLHGSHHSVFVQVKPGVFERRPVIPEYEGSKEVVIKKGLDLGDLVVVDNALLLAKLLTVAQDEAGTNENSNRAVTSAEQRSSLK